MTDTPDRDPSRREELMFLLLHGGARTEDIAHRAVDLAIAEAVAAAYQKAMDAVRAEYLHDETGTPEDEAYNQAINDAVVAIRNLKEQR